jgi:hypothetical protein
MKVLLTPIICGFAWASALGQTTNTNCTQIGSQVNCTSTTDNSAQQNAEASRRAGEQVGTAIGTAIARHNQIKNYCKFHPGEEWHSEDWARAGTCKVPNEKKIAKVKTSDSSHFAPDSPEAIEWCSHQPNGLSYTGSDGASHPCPAKHTSVASQPNSTTATLRPGAALVKPVTNVAPSTNSTMKWAGEWHVVGTHLQCVYRYQKTDGTPVIFTQLYDFGQPPPTITGEMASTRCPL